MELKPGYKQTEAGVIPEDWNVEHIRDLKPFVTSGSRGWAAFYSDQGSSFVRITNLSRSTIYLDLRDLRFVNIPTTDSEAVRTRLQDGDVLISITADIGIIGHVTSKVPKPAYINQHIALLRFDPTQTCSRFVSYFLASEKPQGLFRALTDSGAKAGMNLTTVQKVCLALPPTLAEQEAIAEALSDADALIESMEQLIAKKRQIKQGAMQELLTGKRRLPGFEIKASYKQSEVGVIPEEWEVKSLGSFCEIAAGRDLVKEDFSPTSDHRHQFPIYSNSLTNKGLYGYSNSYQYEPDKITVTARGGIGHAVYRNTRFCAIGRLLVLFSKHPCDLRFVTEFINSFVDFALESTGVPQLTAPQFSKYAVALPPTKAEQTAIAAILSDMDAEIAALEAKLAKARQIKQGMMQELLTGRIRLI